jgi:hypothetical protein
MRVKLWLALTSVFTPLTAFGQHVTCTADVPQETCKVADAAFEASESLLVYKVPVVITDPASFDKEQKSLQFPINRFGLVRDPAASQRYSRLIMLERINGKPCPVRVLVSTDEFRPLDVATLKRVPGFERDTVFSTADFVGAFLSGCESSLDY